MTIHRLCLLGSALFLLASCTEAGQPTMPDAIVLASHVTEGVGPRVVGSGHVESAAGLREFTFHAVERPDGSVTGSYKIVLPNGLFFEADVTCLAVGGDTGWVAGTIRDTNAGVVIVGSTSMFYAIDGGEGEGATDVVSIAAFNGAEGADLAFCEDRPLALAPLTVTQGNVQVH